MKPVDTPTQPFDEATITSLARKASGRADLRLEGWQAQEISGGADFTSRIQRISGLGKANGEAIPWSVILKTIHCEPGISTNPQASHYWKREPYYYQSGLLENLPGGLRAPRCYAVLEQEDSCSLFLEDLRNTCQAADPAQGWSLEEYRTASHCLGQFNGAYLTGTPIPEGDCIPRNWFRAYLEECTSNMELFSRSTDHPIIKRCLGELPAELILQAWEQRGEILEVLDRLPQVFCHNDAFHRNLFTEHTDRGNRLVVVDWTYGGPGALGIDLVPLVSAGIGMGGGHFSEGTRIAQVALEGYLEGLGEVGWHGDHDLVLFGFSAGCFWRYPIGMFIGEFIINVLDEAKRLHFEQLAGVSIEPVADVVGELMSWSLPYYEETWRLKKKLGL